MVLFFATDAVIFALSGGFSGKMNPQKPDKKLCSV
jgi:hypothetical protein